MTWCLCHGFIAWHRHHFHQVPAWYANAQGGPGNSPQCSRRRFRMFAHYLPFIIRVDESCSVTQAAI